MDFLEMVLQCTLQKIVEISDQCTDPVTAERLDNLYDETVDKLVSVKRAKNWGVLVEIFENGEEM